MWLAAQIDPTIWPTYIASAGRVLRRRIRGQRRFEGDAAAIIEAVIDACWADDHYNASAGHFRQAWTRDLGFAAGSLVALGRRERLHAALAWMLDVWSADGHVSTTIMGRRQARDIWTYGVDALPLLIHSLVVAEADDLIEAHAGWLRDEVAGYGTTVIDPASGLVRDDRSFSTHRDTIPSRSNAYANAMAALLDKRLRETDWFPSPIPAGAADRFVDAFWRGDRFVERQDSDEVTGDATVIPFFYGIVPDDLGLREALRSAEDAGLADPLPLRYSAEPDPGAADLVPRLFVPDYQGSAVWTSLGAMYLRLLQRVDAESAADVGRAYRKIVERDGTVLEVYDGQKPGLVPYRGTLGVFLADEAMLWGAILGEAFAADPEVSSTTS